MARLSHALPKTHFEIVFSAITLAAVWRGADARVAWHRRVGDPLYTCSGATRASVLRMFCKLKPFSVPVSFLLAGRGVEKGTCQLHRPRHLPGRCRSRV